MKTLNSNTGFILIAVFLTGSDRIPIHGMKAVPVSISCEAQYLNIINIEYKMPFFDIQRVASTDILDLTIKNCFEYS